MLGSEYLDLAVALAFVYMLFSLLCTSASEGISQLLSLRAKNLRAGVESLLQDEKLVDAFYRHPLVRCLGHPASKVPKPSYIPSRTFAIALIDCLRSAVADESGGKSGSLENPREILEKLPEGGLKRSLLTMVDSTEQKIEETYHHLESWFDSTMDRASGWYKRKSQIIVLVIGVGIVCGANLDTLELIEGFWRSSALRDSVVAAAEKATASGAALSEGSVQDLSALSNSLDLPLGWPSLQELRDLTWGQKAQKVVGLILSALAISLGAPFWFDLLNRLIRLRGSGKVETTRASPRMRPETAKADSGP